MADEPTSLDLLKAVLDPVRLAVLGGSVGAPTSMAEIESRTGATRREIAEAIGSLRSAGLVDPDGRAITEALRAIAMELPSERSESTSVIGPWTDKEREVLARFFDGDRLRSIPTNITKRRLVLELIAQGFEPGVRYHERDVNFRIQLIYPDYAAIRRYLVDEGFMDRADGAYWRTGGRLDVRKPPSDTPAFSTTIATSREDVQLKVYDHTMTTDLVRAANHREINRYMSDRFPHPYTPAAASDWISFTLDESEPLNYAVVASGHLVGGVGARGLGGERTGTFEFGWWLTPSHWGRGITSVAATALVDELFGKRGAMALWAPVMAPNLASAGVARKLGMALEGTRRSVCLKGGVRHDELDFGLTRAQWASS